MKKIPLKICIMLVVAVVLAVISGLLFGRIVSNHAFVKAYDEGVYQPQREESLLTFNIPESYLPYYNLGNVAYEKGDYNSAIGYYTHALNLFPTGQKECDVRINLALAMCYNIDFENLTTQEAVDTALLVLYKARGILLENDWATEDGQGHRDDDAQQLKEDIDKMIEQLQNQQGDDSKDNKDQQDQKDSNQDQNNQDDSQGQSEKEKKQQEKLEKNKKDALEERKQEQDEIEKWSGKGGSDSEGGSGSDGDGGYVKPW